MKTLLISLALTFSFLSSVNAGNRGPLAQGDLTKYPDLTADFSVSHGTRIVGLDTNTSSDGGRVMILDAFIADNMFAKSLVAEVAIENLDYSKDIFIHEVDGNGKIINTVHLKSDSYPSLTYRRRLFTNRVWDVFTIKGPIQQTSSWARKVIEVKMRGQSYWSGYFTLGM